jgi:large repetitive protein
MKSVARKPMIVILRYSLCILLFLNITSVFGQNLAQHNWYFGNTKDGIRFNRGNNKAQAVTDQAIPFGAGGSAVATDPATADLLFYTDGVNVYNSCHLLMQNGVGLTGNPSFNQPAVISPVPKQLSKYYIFTNNGSIAASIVDMKAPLLPPLGGIEPASKNSPVAGLTNRSEGMIVIPHSNGDDFWLITHEINTNLYTVSTIDVSGTFTPKSIVALGTPVSVANFSYNHKLKKLAVAVQSPIDNSLILTFNPATGILGFDRLIPNSGVTTGLGPAIYDIQWDMKGGQYLYISRIGEPGIAADVLQYDYNNPTVSLASVLPPSVQSTISKSYGLQLAPDSSIYHLYQSAAGAFFIEKFSKTDTVASGVVKTPQPFGAIDFAGTQFPSFSPQGKVDLNVSFTTAGTCQNNPITFFPNVTPNADSLQWDFGDGGSSKAWSPIHTFAQAQAFNVSLTAFYQGQKKPVTQQVTINPFTLKLQLVQDTTACRDEFPPPRGTATPANQFKVKVKVTQGSASSFNWSNGDLGDTLTPDSAGYYYVVATDATGCSTYAGVNVKEYKLNDQRSNIWYFGNKAGIDFNKNPPEALSNSAMNAPEGCAIVCDRNGKTIFYTDGDKVYDKTNTQIDVGIGGDPSSAQSALIVPVPGDETLYYIFTTQAADKIGTLFEVRYSIFDLKKNGGNGQVTQKNVLLFSKGTERITANGSWIIVHEYGNSTFRTYPISRQGIGEAVYSDIGSVHSIKSLANGQGYMRLGPRGNLAVALSTTTPGASNIIELFQLDNATGIISNFRKVDMNQSSGQVYGLEFSPGGRKLFATINGSPSSIYEYYLDSLDVQPPVLLGVPTQTPSELGALQISPDRRTIYFAIKGSNSLGSIIANEDKIPTSSSAPIFNAPPPLAGGTNSLLGLPNFVQQQGSGFGGPGFTFAGVCLGDTTRFVGTPTDAIDVFLWTFGDGASSSDPSPKHLYATAGPFTVTMQLTNRCGLDTTIVQKIIVNPPAPKSTMPPTSVLCNGPVTLFAYSPTVPPGVNSIWSDGTLGNQVTLSQPGVVSVTNTDANGCKSTAKALVVDNRPIVELGPDLTICEKAIIPDLISNNSGATIVWTANGINTGNNDNTSQIVDTNIPLVPPYTRKYEVTVTDPVTLCQVKDDITYTINVSPSFTMAQVGANPTCNMADGQVSLTLITTNPAGGPYSYDVSGTNVFSSSGIDQVAPSIIGPITGVSAGTVIGIVTDQITGCPSTSSVSLSDAAFTGAAGFSNCNPSTVTVTIPSGSPVAPVLYTFTPIGVTPVIGINFFGPQTGNQAKLPPGKYSIQMRENNGTGCTYSFEQVVNPTSPTVVIMKSDLCVIPANLEAIVTGGTAVSYAWTQTLPDGSIRTFPGNVNPLPIPNPNGTGVYKVVANLDPIGDCQLSNSASIFYEPNVTVDFAQSDACKDQVVLTATTTPAGNFTYRWYKNGNNAIVAGLGKQITVGTADDGATYEVEAVDAFNGCKPRSNPKAVKVNGPPTDIGLSATLACQDDDDPLTVTDPFVITATPTTGVTYKWFRNKVELTGQTSSTLSETRDGIYEVIVNKANTSSCPASKSIEIIKIPLPKGLLDDRAVICTEPPTPETKELNPGVHKTYDWFYQVNITSTKQSKGSTPTITASEPGIYLVDITNPQGCKNTDKIEILNECIPKIVGPNAFRPANAIDAINKDFFVYSFHIDPTAFEISIFNRWGEIVFHSTETGFKWNGSYGGNSGEPLPGGTYAYVITYKSNNQNDPAIKEKRGGVVLLR